MSKGMMNAEANFTPNSTENGNFSSLGKKNQAKGLVTLQVWMQEEFIWNSHKKMFIGLKAEAKEQPEVRHLHHRSD